MLARENILFILNLIHLNDFGAKLSAMWWLLLV